ncbi:uncharacterized protein LOC135817727 [Sycon ciliatum]|uniref:uncharacterized protein LOC135817727 n=1 Tax=Sycon ciliatum TaxID=27933 RepID=UPI0031F71AD4
MSQTPSGRRKPISPAVAEARRGFFSTSNTGTAGANDNSSVSGAAMKAASLNRDAGENRMVAPVRALPRHMVLQADTSGIAGSDGATAADEPGMVLEASTGLSKSLNDLDAMNGRLKEDNSVLHLKDEQRRLKQDVSDKKRGIARLQKISDELTMLLQQHHYLQEAASKRERLGHTMRQRLEERCQKLEATNRQLTSQLEQERISPGSTHVQAQEDMREALIKRDQMIKSLQSQHDTCAGTIGNLQQQHTRLLQDMAWLKVLQDAVVASEVKLQYAEEELAKQVEFNSRLPQLEEEFLGLQDASQQQRARHAERIRQLQRESSELSSQLQARGDELLPLKLCVPPTIARDLEQLVVQRDQHVSVLTDEVLRWQQLYMDELREGTAARQAASPKLITRRLASAESPGIARRSIGAPQFLSSNLVRGSADASRRSGRKNTEQQLERRRQDLNMAMQHQLELEAGIKTLEHLVNHQELELLELQQQQQGVEDGAALASTRYSVAHSARSRVVSGNATPSSIFSYPLPGSHALKPGQWATSSFHSYTPRASAAEPSNGGSVTASPVRKPPHFGSQQAVSSLPTQTPPRGNDGPLSSKDDVILQIQDDCMV